MKKKPEIETIFKESLDQQMVEPSPEVLTGLRRKLFISDFFSLNYRKFNVAYVGLAAVLIALLPSLSNNNSDLNDTRKIEKNIPAISNAEGLEEIKEEEPEAQEELVEAVIAEKQLVSLFDLDVKSGCEPLTITFENQSKNAKSFSWHFGTGDVSEKESPVYTFRKAGTYNVKLTAINSAGVKSDYFQTIKVYKKPATSFNVNVEESDVNARKVFFENKSAGASKYKWSFGDDTYSEEVSPTHIYTEYKTYNVSMIAISDRGCSDTTSYFNSFVAENYSLIFPKKFKPNVTRANNGAYDRPENAPFVFYPRNHGASEYSLTVNNPNGVEVFRTGNIKQGWNGYVNGRVASPGKYFYSASGVYPNGQPFKFNGTFSVVVDQSFNDYYDN